MDHVVSFHDFFLAGGCWLSGLGWRGSINPNRLKNHTTHRRKHVSAGLIIGKSLSTLPRSATANRQGLFFSREGVRARNRLPALPTESIAHGDLNASKMLARRAITGATMACVLGLQSSLSVLISRAKMARTRKTV